MINKKSITIIVTSLAIYLIALITCINFPQKFPSISFIILSPYFILGNAIILFFTFIGNNTKSITARLIDQIDNPDNSKTLILKDLKGNEYEFNSSSNIDYNPNSIYLVIKEKGIIQSVNPLSLLDGQYSDFLSAEQKLINSHKEEKKSLFKTISVFFIIIIITLGIGFLCNNYFIKGWITSGEKIKGEIINYTFITKSTHRDSYGDTREVKKEVPVIRFISNGKMIEKFYDYRVFTYKRPIGTKINIIYDKSKDKIMEVSMYELYFPITSVAIVIYFELLFLFSVYWYAYKNSAD